MKKARWINTTGRHTYESWGLGLGPISVIVVRENVLLEHGEIPGWECEVRLGGLRLEHRRFDVHDPDKAKAKAEALTRKTVEALAKALARLPSTKPTKKR